MREILFKGFHKCKNGDTVITVNGVEKRGMWVEGDLYHKMNEENRLLVVPFNKFGKDVISETVSQFTGLTDKNGKRIFEGDIILIDKKIRAYPTQRIECVVFYEQETCAFSVSDDFVFNSDAGFLCDCENIEVVRNIFENADLMEGK